MANRYPWLDPEMPTPDTFYGGLEDQFKQAYEGTPTTPGIDEIVRQAGLRAGTLDLGAQAAYQRYQQMFQRPMPQQSMGDIMDQGFGNIGSVLAGDQQFGRQAAMRGQQNLQDARQMRAMQVDQLLGEYNRMIQAAMDQKKYAEALDMSTRAEKLTGMANLAKMRRDEDFEQAKLRFEWEKLQDQQDARRQEAAEREREREAARRKSYGGEIMSSVDRARKGLDVNASKYATLRSRKDPAKPEELVSITGARRGFVKQMIQSPQVNPVSFEPLDEDQADIQTDIESTIRQYAAMSAATDGLPIVGWGKKDAVNAWRTRKEFEEDIRSALNARLSGNRHPAFQSPGARQNAVNDITQQLLYLADEMGLK